MGTQYLKDEYTDLASREVKFANACSEWVRYKEWKKSRNKARAVLEEKFGFDTKHAAHLVRLMRQGKEILQTGKLLVDRTGIDADELRAIRGGAWSYDQLEQYAKDCDKEMGELYTTTTVRDRPDHDAVHELCVDLVGDYLQN